MEPETQDSGSRRIRIFTESSTIEGQLATSRGASTLHCLNVIAASQNLLAISPPLRIPDDWDFEQAPLSVSTDDIVMVFEVSQYEPTPEDPRAAARFHRSPISLRVGSYAIEGYIHVTPGGDPIARLNQDRHRFIAITSASVIGSDDQFAAPFLAVNRAFIRAAQCLPSEQQFEQDPDLAAVGEVLADS